MVQGKEIRMFKLRKYLKPFVLSILAIIVLLFAQAMFELSMPDYMSKIVNVGINAGGIEDGVLQAVRETEYKKLSVFMSKDEKTLFENNYTLVLPNQANEDQITSYPILKQEAIYILNDISKETKESLRNALSSAEICVMSISKMSSFTSENNANMSEEQQKFIEMMKNVPENTDIFTVLQALPENQLLSIKDSITKQLSAMGESSINTASASYVKGEYQAIQMDTDAIQYAYLFHNGGIMLLFALGSALTAITVGFLASRIAAGFSRDIRRDVFRKVESFSNTEFNKFSTNTLITRTTNDVQQVQTVTVMILRMVIYAPIIGIGALLKVISSNADMTWIIGLVVAIIVGIMASAFALVLPKFRIQQKLMDKLNSVVREILDGMPVIRAFNTQAIEKQKFEKANKDIMKTQLFVSRAMGLLLPLIFLVMNCSSILIVWIGAHQIDAGSLMIGDMIAFIQYTMQIIIAFMMVTMISIMIPRASVAAARIYEVLSCDVVIQDPKDKKEFKKDKKGEVVFSNVSFRYPGAEEDVLHNLNFTVESGKTTAFIGSTGSGKSTLVNLVPRFFDVTDGEILVDGVNIKDVSQYDLRDKIGYVPQKGYLFSGTIASNLRYANQDADEQDMTNAAEVAQALEFIEQKPERFDTEIAQGGTNVSGGQRQRLSIARALMKKPEIYIFDDTFSALDFKTDARLRKALRKMCEENGSTVMLVAQRISSIMHADRIIVLDQGSIVGMGTHTELMKSCPVYQEIAYSQLSKEELENE